MATKSLKDLDHLQSSIKSIVEDALNQVDILQKSLHNSQQLCDSLTKKNKELTDCINSVKASDSEGLFVKYVELAHNFEEYKKRTEFACCSQCKEYLNNARNDGVDEQIRKELEEISSLELDTQFEADSPCIVQETPSPSVFFQSKTLPKSNVARNLMLSIFGTFPEKNDVVLAEDTPVEIPPAYCETLCNFVPESVPDTSCERTPDKSNFHQEKPVICTTPVEKLMNAKKLRMGGNEISPTWQSLFSPVKSSPKKSSPKGLNRTPSKRFLKKSHRIKPENTAQGVKMFSQTQLKWDSFKKVQVQENMNPVGEVVNQIKMSSTPLNSVENNIDLNETSLTASALRRLADVNKKDVKEEFLSSYDRIPDDSCMETGKACRNKLPGLECQDCKKWYNHFDHGDEAERRKLLDQYSRHRTKYIPISNTPEGYWKPMMSPSQRN